MRGEATEVTSSVAGEENCEADLRLGGKTAVIGLELLGLLAI